MHDAAGTALQLNGDQKIAKALPVWLRSKRRAAGMFRAHVRPLGLLPPRPLAQNGCTDSVPNTTLR